MHFTTMQPHSSSPTIIHPEWPEPSAADLNITHRLRDALALVDVRVVDHVVVAVGSFVSMAQRGLL